MRDCGCAFRFVSDQAKVVTHTLKQAGSPRKDHRRTLAPLPEQLLGGLEGLLLEQGRVRSAPWAPGWVWRSDWSPE